MQGGSGEGRQGLEAGAAYRSRAPYSAAELAGLVWGEKVVLGLAFAIVFALGVAAVLLLPKTYEARSSLLVGLGQEYVYQPRAGDAARGAIPQVADVVRSEVEILSSDELKRRVVHALGVETIDPKLGPAWSQGDPVRRRLIEGQAVLAVGCGLSIDTTPDTGVVRLSFRHGDPETAAQVLNTLVEAYLVYRRQVLSDPTSPLLAREKALFQARLAEADAAYERFQSENGIGDFPTEKAALATLHQSLVDDRYKAEAAYSEANSRLAALNRGLAGAPAEIEIQRDLDLSASARLMSLRVERRDLLSRYKPEAAPVKEIDAKIAALEAFVASPASAGEKDRRMGANPVRQDIERQRIEIQAQAAAAARRRDEIRRQLDEVTKRQQRLTVLESRYQTLTVEREVLQANVKSFAQRQEEARAAQDLARDGDDSIRVVERASAPVEAKGLKRPLLILVLLVALVCAVGAALVRVFSRRGFATAGAAARALDLPVLATAPLKRA